MKHLRNKSDDALSVVKRYFGSVNKARLWPRIAFRRWRNSRRRSRLETVLRLIAGGLSVSGPQILFTDDSKKLLTSIGRSLIRVRWSSPCDPHRHLRRGLCGDRLYTAARRQHWPAGDRAPNGQYRVWLLRAIVDRLARMRGARESYSDVILRLGAARKSV
jgi:hypothetical protein